MDFDYFYNREAEGFNFLKVPEILVEGEEFQGLSAEAILLYAMLLKRANCIERGEKYLFRCYNLKNMEKEGFRVGLYCKVI